MVILMKSVKNNIFKSMIVICFVLLAVGYVASASSTSDRNSQMLTDEEYAFDVMKMNVDCANAQIENVPDIVRSLVFDKNLMFRLQMEDGDMLYIQSIVENGKIVHFERYEPTDQVDLSYRPDIVIESRMNVVYDVFVSDNPIMRGLSHLRNDNVNVMCNSLGDRLMLRTLKFMS
jgi:hypothetical protein